VNTSDALARIAAIVGPAGVIAPRDAQPLLRDQRELFRGEAALVVRPASTAECAEVLAVCHAAGLGVVPQGGNTGYCGGATPFDAGRQVLLSLTRMHRIREIDPLGFTMTVEAGVVLAAAQRAAEEAGLLFPLSMGSEGSCQIGGNLSTNAGGLAVLRYGTARDLVLGIEVVLPSGGVLSELKGLRKDNAGYDLRALFLGAEGTLGVITAAVLKLLPRPQVYETAWLAVAGPQAACELVARARRETGDQVSSAEYVSRRSLDLVLERLPEARDPLDVAHEHYLLLEIAATGDPSLVRSRFETVLQAAFEAGEVRDAAIADSGTQRAALWLLRERIPEAERRDGGSIKHDIAVRIGRIPELIERAEAELAPLGAHRLSFYGHIGDGNLHFNLLPPVGVALEAFRERTGGALTRRVYDLTAELGGSFSAEHGVGILKRDELEHYKSPEALRLMRAVKAALDPRGIMNPGKVVG
jgi:FAD/FMN-containing dehydrogenase